MQELSQSSVAYRHPRLLHKYFPLLRLSVIWRQASQTSRFRENKAGVKLLQTYSHRTFCLHTDTAYDQSTSIQAGAQKEAPFTMQHMVSQFIIVRFKDHNNAGSADCHLSWCISVWINDYRPIWQLQNDISVTTKWAISQTFAAVEKKACRSTTGNI